MNKNKQLYGDEFPRIIGRLGALLSRGGFFHRDYVDEHGRTGRELARIYGAVGGRMPRRTAIKSKSKGAPAKPAAPTIPFAIYEHTAYQTYFKCRVDSARFITKHKYEIHYRAEHSELIGGAAA